MGLCVSAMFDFDYPPPSCFNLSAYKASMRPSRAFLRRSECRGGRRFIVLGNEIFYMTNHFLFPAASGLDLSGTVRERKEGRE